MVQIWIAKRWWHPVSVHVLHLYLLLPGYNIFVPARPTPLVSVVSSNDNVLNVRIISDFCILLVRHPTFSWGGGWGQHFPSLLSVDKYSYINVYLIFITTSSIKYIETSGKCWDQNIYFLLIISVQDWAGITFNLLDQRPGVQLLPPSLNQRGVELQLYHGFEELGVKSAFPPSR